MFLGHFALGVATKPAMPSLPVGALLLAPQAMDLVFLPLVAVGAEGFEQGDYGQDGIDALYSHSVVGAVLISLAVFWLARRLWRSATGAWLLAGLSFSHWPIDLLVHHKDLSILPGNTGVLPLMGFGLWDYPRAVLTIEIVLAVAALAVYWVWAHRARLSTRWYLGPTIITVLFAVMALSDLGRLPA